MYIRHGVALACAGAVGVILAGAPAAAAPSVDPALARAVAQHLALDGAPVIKVQREGRGRDRSEARGGREGRSDVRRRGRDDDRRTSRSSRREYDEPRRDGREYRRRRDDGRRDRDRRHRRDRDGPSIYLSIPFFDPYPYSYYGSGRVYGGGRCAVWRDRCAANWGYGNSNFYGCMRYYGCY